MLPGLDLESAAWIADLSSDGPARDGATARLHDILLRVARAESARRRASLPSLSGGEVDDLCLQAADDALMAILRKLPEFRGTARFTTWACKFVIFEISTKLRRSAWRGRRVEIGEAAWATIPDRGPAPLGTLLDAELGAALQRAISGSLTPAQREIFQAAAIDEIPIDVLAERLHRTRGAIYKMLHDARSNLRRALIAAGYEGAVS
ncbi:MAG TPA: sigma-70 family RNA polymerase sigma factor [Gemmatimonadales bacterium]|nr:sigma-70 family RNA polymerase sigma factor [Gemmatimonadales bacterium]